MLLPFFWVSTAFAVQTDVPAQPAAEKNVPANGGASRVRRAFELPEITAEDVAKVVRPGTLLMLTDAIPQALRKNLGLAVGRVEKSIVEDTPDIAQAAFDPKFSFSSTYDTTGTTPYWKNNSARTSNQGWNNSVELSKKFAFGTEAKIYGNFNRGYNLDGNAPYTADSSVAAGVSVVQPLLKGFGKKINLAPLVIARQNVLKSGLSLRKTTLDLIYDTEVAYWNLSASYALVSARLSSLRHAESVLEQVRKKRELKSGRAATLEDVLQAEAEVASRRVNLVRARQSVEDCDDRIRKLLGEKGDEDETLVYRVATLAETPENRETRSFGEWISAVRVFDIDLQIQEIEREQAALNREVAENADKPNLDLVLGAEVGGRESSPWDAVRGAYGNDRRGYNLSAGIQFSVPVGFRASEAELRQAMKRQQNVELATAQALQNAMFDARSAWRSLEAARERLAAAQVALKMQNESFKGQRARYSLGEATLTDVLSAQDSLDTARLEEIQAQLDVAVARAKTARLDGRILSENGFTWNELDESAE
ncbi:MAG: TolC family protein [Opitutales bacterium]|nr:TolC family protein [Opitutales bacterium]